LRAATICVILSITKADLKAEFRKAIMTWLIPLPFGCQTPFWHPEFHCRAADRDDLKGLIEHDLF
jgi:hypothetical protein